MLRFFYAYSYYVLSIHSSIFLSFEVNIKLHRNSILIVV